MSRSLSLSNGVTQTVSLFVRRDYIEGRPSRCWRLYWAVSVESNLVMAAASSVTSPDREVHFPTMAAAIAHGSRRYGETAVRMAD